MGARAQALKWRHGWRNVQFREQAAAHTIAGLWAEGPNYTALKRVNALGLVTLSHSPAQEQDRWRSRESLTAWGPSDLVKDVAVACQRAGLWVVVRPIVSARPRVSPPACLPGEGEWWRWVGERRWTRDGQWCAHTREGLFHLRHHYPWKIAPSLREEITTRSLGLIVVDEDWGRGQMVMKAVLHALRDTKLAR